MTILGEATLMVPPLAVRTEMHRVDCIRVIELLADTRAGVNSDGLKHDAKNRTKTERLKITHTGVAPSCESNPRRV
jgi:hypothetical protein